MSTDSNSRAGGTAAIKEGSSELTVSPLALLRVSSDFDSAAIRIYDGRGDGKPLHTLTALHRSSVHLMAVSPRPFRSRQHSLY